MDKRKENGMMIKYADKKKKDEQLYTAPNNEHTVKIQFVFVFFFQILSALVIRQHHPSPSTPEGKAVSIYPLPSSPVFSLSSADKYTAFSSPRCSNRDTGDNNTPLTVLAHAHWVESGRPGDRPSAAVF